MTVAVDDDLWSAIGDPTRRRMLDLLLADGGGTATTLSEQLPVTRQAVAKHLGVLDRVGLVHVTPAGRERRYQVDDAQLARAVAQLSDVGADLGRPAAAHQADRRGDPAQPGRAQPATATTSEERTRDDGRHPAQDRRRERVAGRRLRRRSPRVDGLAGWWTDDTHGRRARSAASLEFRFAPRRLRHEGARARARPSACVWEVVDGPDGVDRHAPSTATSRRTATTRSCCSSTRAGRSRSSSCTTAAPSGRRS